MFVGSVIKILCKVFNDEMKWKTQGTEEYFMLTKHCNATLK